MSSTVIGKEVRQRAVRQKKLEERATDISCQIITIKTNMCIPYFFMTQSLLGKHAANSTTQTCTHLVWFPTIRKPSRKLVKGCKTRLGFIMKIKEGRQTGKCKRATSNNPNTVL